MYVGGPKLHACEYDYIVVTCMYCYSNRHLYTDNIYALQEAKIMGVRKYDIHKAICQHLIILDKFKNILTKVCITSNIFK